MPLMARGLTTHAHCQYVIVAFLQSGGARDKTEMPTETVEDHCQVECSAHPHTSTTSLSLFLWHIPTIRLVSDYLAGKTEMVDGFWGENDGYVRVIPYQLTYRAPPVHVIFLGGGKKNHVKSSIKFMTPCEIL